METLLFTIFVVGYLAIALEHNLKIDKLVPALIMMSVLWSILGLFHMDVFEVDLENQILERGDMHNILVHHLGKTSEILFFLMGAMIIVEIIDYFRAFDVVKNLIRSKKKKQLIWIFGSLAFVLSAVIDNLTATIVLITILQKIVPNKNERFWFAGVIIIAANAGGAWSPIGDVTTTMLWIDKKVTSLKLIEHVLGPSIICFAVPTFIMSFMPAFKGNIVEVKQPKEAKLKNLSILLTGLGGIIFVPIFKGITGLPPYMGMCLSMAILVIVAERKTKRHFSFKKLVVQKGSLIHHSLSEIEFSSILFFLGILMSVAALESIGGLFHFAAYLNEKIPSQELIIFLLGIGSAIVDNVPLVAAGIGMFPEPMDDKVWHLLAYSAGTGGSILIIGSAAGVIAMGMEKIEFFKYIKNITLLAFLGFICGYIFMLFF